MTGRSRLRPSPVGPWGLSVVRGESMRPTLAPGDLLVVRWGGEVRSGALVVAELPGGRGLGVKRVLRAEPLADGRAGWWLERDNPRAGTDSWVFGAVATVAVRGVVTARVWPRPRRL